MNRVALRVTDVDPWREARCEAASTTFRDSRGIVEIAKATFLSDTIVIAIEVIWPGENVRFWKAVPVMMVAHQVGRVIEDALTSDPTFAYRGCIAHGEFAIDDPFVVGEAIDEAAEHYERAEAAIVWLAPSARRAWEGGRDELAADSLQDLVPYAVPLKESGRGLAA